jgi:hypothetical protein
MNFTFQVMSVTVCDDTLALILKLTDIFVEYFIYHWWSTIEQIDKINIFIESYTGINTRNNNTQTNLEKYRRILFDKNNQIDSSFRTTV